MVGSTIVEDIFLENGGVFVLMSLLKVAGLKLYCLISSLSQSCPKVMQSVLLGILVDICDNSKVTDISFCYFMPLPL